MTAGATATTPAPSSASNTVGVHTRPPTWAEKRAGPWPYVWITPTGLARYPAITLTHAEIVQADSTGEPVTFRAAGLGTLIYNPKPRPRGRLVAVGHAKYEREAVCD